jgi:excisionase family DNA binding protein
MAKIEIDSISMEELEIKIKQWVREVLSEQKSTSHNPSKPMNAREAADYLGMSKGTLYKKTATQEIPYIKRGKVLLFHKGELDSWLESGRKEPVQKVMEQTVQRSFIRQIRGKS